MRERDRDSGDPGGFGRAGHRGSGFAPRRAEPTVRAPLHPVLALQRAAGNRAVAAWCAAQHDQSVPGGAGRALPGEGHHASPRGGRDAGAVVAPAVVALQRAIIWHNHDKEGALTKFGDGLGALVDVAAAEILAKPDAVQAVNGYVDLWHATYQAFMAGEDMSAFIHARFGYAVEALTCAKVAAGALDLPDGWRFDLQVASGMTRPDIVVSDDKGVQQGWFDITSDASTGHIFKKTGSQWSTRPYVGEAVYPALRLTDLQVSGATAADTVKRRRLAKDEEKKQEQSADLLAGHVSAVYRRMVEGRAEELSSDAGKWRRAFEEEMHQRLVAETGWKSTGDKLAPSVARSLLAHLDQAGVSGPSGSPWLATMGYVGASANGRNRPALLQILDLLDS